MPGKFLIAAMIVVSVLAGCRQEPLQNVNGVEITARGLSLEQTEQAITMAGARRGWVFERVEPGKMTGRLDIRGKHTAIVDVLYSTNSFSILYNNSHNMNADVAQGLIHPNYNAWVRNLRKDIREQLAAASGT